MLTIIILYASLCDDIFTEEFLAYISTL